MMSPKPSSKIYGLAAAVLAVAALITAGCTSSINGTTNQGSVPSGPAFVVGTDAPLASVVSFKVPVQSITLTSTTGSTANLISGTPTVDFARFNGLQTLLDMNDVPAGTYTSVTVSLASTGTIGYLNTGSGAPTIASMNAAISPASTTITLPKSLVIAQNGTPVGLRLDLDLAESIAVDSNGQITGGVTPNFDARAVQNNDNGGYIDTFIAGVISVNQTAQSFIVQGPHGENFTIDVNGSTEWDGTASLSTLTANDIVELSGKMDPADQTLDADEVNILSDSGFFARGQVTYVTPSSGVATSFDLYVRALEPTNTGLSLGQIAQVNLSGNEKYSIYWMHNPFTNFLFNSSAMVAGQAVTIGGPASGAANANAVTVNRVNLHNWGFNGTIVAGSQNSSAGTFQMQIKGFAGVLIPETVTVYLGNHCDFRYGMGAFSDLTDGSSIRVVGLLLKNPTNGQVVLLARHVDGSNFTDFSTFSF